MSIKTISAGIASVFASLVTTGKVKAIYEYAKTDPIGYPYIEIVPTGYEARYLTNTQNQMEYAFEVRIHQEKSNEARGEVNAQDDINQVLDDVVTILTAQQFASNPLNGSCDFIRPSVTLGTESTSDLPEIIQTITLTIVKLV